MFEISRESLQGQDIIVLGAYKPWGYHKENGGDGSNYPQHSGRILDIKEGKPQGVKHFADFMIPRIKKAEVIVIVPSHDPAKVGGGLAMLAAKIAGEGVCADGSACLVRHTKIEKLAN